MNRLSQWRKAGYGAGESGGSAIEFLLQLHLLYFATQITGLPASWAGAAIAAAIVWDAVSDPLMGLILDRTHTRRGRYSPYLLSGCVVLGISVWVLFNPPPFSSRVADLLYLLSAYLLVNTAMTVFAVPHIAMGGHLSRDRHERTQLYGWRLVFGTVGLLLGLLLPFAVAGASGLDFDVTEERGVILGRTALVFGVVMVVAGLVTLLAVRSRDCGYSIDNERLSVRQVGREFAGVLRDRIFLPLFGAFVAASIARAINASTAFYYYEFTLRLPTATVVAAVLLPFVFSIMVSVPAWVWVSKRLGKKQPALWGISTLGILIAVSYPFFPAERLAGPVFLALAGGAAVGAIVLFESLVADVTDYGELKSGKRREGVYFGVWRMGTKLARAAAIGLTGLMLDWIGFQAGAEEQTPEVAARLAWIFGPVVGGFFLLGALIFFWFPLTEKRHARVQELLRRKRAGR